MVPGRENLLNGCVSRGTASCLLCLKNDRQYCLHELIAGVLSHTRNSFKLLMFSHVYLNFRGIEERVIAYFYLFYSFISRCKF